MTITESFSGYSLKPAKTKAVTTVVFVVVVVVVVTVRIVIYRFQDYALVSSYKQTLVGLLSICVFLKLIKR